MYAVSVIALIVTLRDGRIMWYEALVLVLMYFIYIAGRVFMIYFVVNVSLLLYSLYYINTIQMYIMYSCSYVL